jgi:type IV secretory pathway VirB10-like protein
MTDTILEQLTDTDSALAQLIELAIGNEPWRRERRDARGEWTRSGRAPGTPSTGRAFKPRADPNMSVVNTKALTRQAQTNRQAAAEAVAAKISEQKARAALEEARRELEKTRQELEETARTEENAKHRTKLAIHALLVTAGAILAAVMVHFDVSPVLASFGAAMPLLTTELVDWRKKL